MTLKTFIDVGIVAELTGQADLQQPTAPGRLRRVLSWTDTEADLLWADRRTLAASASDSLDLAGGGLTDAFGQPLTFARVLAVMVVAGTRTVQLSRPASNGVPIFLAGGDGIEVRPGSPIVLIAADGTGWPVTAGTGDLIAISNPDGSNSATYEIVLVGKST